MKPLSKLPINVQDARKRLSYATRALKLVWAASASWTVVWLILLGLQGLLPAVIVLLTGWLVDSLSSVIGAGVNWANVQLVLMPACLMAGALILDQILGSLTDWVNTAQTELVQDYFKWLIHRKAIAVDYGFYEMSENYDRLEQANTQASTRSLALLQNIGTLLQSVVTLVSIAAILFRYGIIVPLALLFSTIPALIVVVRYNRVYHDWWKKTTQDQRKARYFDTMLTGQLSAAEIRLFDIGGYFIDQYRSIRNRLRNERLVMLRKQIIARLLASAIALVFTGLTMGWMVWRAIGGSARLGDLAIFYQSFSQGQGIMRALLNSMGQIYSNTLFLEHLFEFLATEIALTDPEKPKPVPSPIQKGITFDGVTFTYPGNPRPALENFNLYIPAGKIVAIVGANGAGKSTLIKLLCRFYDVEGGAVRLDGTDIRDVRIGDLRKQISIMFQNPAHFQAPARENIAIGELESIENQDEVERAARAAGAHEFIGRLAHGYDTLLGRWFANGTELSGGEWQRVTVARAFFRRTQIMILDEPTSFMDSWSESDWFDRFKTYAAGKTSLIITHRFTTAMQADVIHVMHNGKIVESGSHEELLALGGSYAESWFTQIKARGHNAMDVEEEDLSTEQQNRNRLNLGTETLWTEPLH